MDDPYDLQRFVSAQVDVYDSVLQELRSGEKRGHWMWYIFPQVKGLGFSSTSQRYAITSPEEAVAYAQHDILGNRLRQCTQLVLEIDGRTAHEIFHSPDDMKFRSCMTLFQFALPDNAIYSDTLGKYFEGNPDPKTLAILKPET